MVDLLLQPRRPLVADWAAGDYLLWLLLMPLLLGLWLSQLSYQVMVALPTDDDDDDVVDGVGVGLKKPSIGHLKFDLIGWDCCHSKARWRSGVAGGPRRLPLRPPPEPVAAGRRRPPPPTETRPPVAAGVSTEHLNGLAGGGGAGCGCGGGQPNCGGEGRGGASFQLRGATAGPAVVAAVRQSEPAADWSQVIAQQHVVAAAAELEAHSSTLGGCGR